MPKIFSWNVNSITARLEHLKKFIEEESPDVILLQELKCMDEKFPTEALEHYGYNLAFTGQKSYNGVAILSKAPIEDVTRGIDGFDDENARYIEAVTAVGKDVIRVASVYVPNGQEVGSEKFAYKMKFFEHLRSHIAERLKYKELYLIGGDFNVAPEDIDVYNPKGLDGTVGFHIDERNHFRRILSTGVYDTFRVAHPKTEQYSWWDYRTNGWKFNRGMRIDQILSSPEATDKIKDAGVLDTFRDLEKPSDHAPIWVELRPY